MNRISVIIPTYNRRDYIGNALESVFFQEGQGVEFEIIEIIIVDDGSSDGTEEIISEIKDERIIYHRLSQNVGANAARNIGINMATGDWIAFQDSDDQWHTNKLDKQIKYSLAHEEYAMIAHPFTAYFDDGSNIVTPIVDERDIIKELAKHNFIGTPTILVKREALRDIGGFDVRLKALQDWDLVLRFADRYSIGMVPQVLLDVNMKVEGISAKASNYYESRCRIISGNREILIKHDCFDDAVRSLLLDAQKSGVFEMVGRMLELYLQE